MHSLPRTHDLLDFESLLSPTERDRLDRTRDFLAGIDEDIINRSWETAEFPFELVAPLAGHGLLGLHLDPQSRPRHLLRGLMTAELARKDASLATFAGVSGSLFGLSIREFGSPQQRAELLPAIGGGDMAGAFALTEPGHGSDIAGGMATTARFEGDQWILNGAKRWIGNATWCEHVVVWAREEDGEGRFLGFVVPKGAAGWTAEKIEGKYSLRSVQNAHITLSNVTLPDSARLPGVNSFRQISDVLKFTRLEVGWVSLGNAIGAFDAAMEHATSHRQFGRPLATFQMVQGLLVRAEMNISSSLGVLSQAARLADAGELREDHASLVKLMAAKQARETVALCRELLGGDGVLLENKVIRHFMDAEAIYTFEGTHQINSLLVGRALTGMSAFV